MKRSDFLKRLGIGLGAVVVAPRVLAEEVAKEPIEKKPMGWHSRTFPSPIETETGMTVHIDKYSKYEIEKAYLLQKRIEEELFLG